MENIRCCCCFGDISDTVQVYIKTKKLDQPWRCERCEALLFITNDLAGIGRAAHMTIGKKPKVFIQLDVASGIHLVCAWDPEKILNATQVARITGVNVSQIIRLIKQNTFPNVQRIGHAWRIPLKDVRKYLFQRAVRQG